MVDGWKDYGLCREVGPDLFFSENRSDSNAAITVCADCPIRQKCLDYALANHIDHGIWGVRATQEASRLAVIAALTIRVEKKCHHRIRYTEMSSLWGTCETARCANTAGRLRSVGGPMNTLESAAIAHLRLLRLERTPQQDELYVKLASRHGLSAALIAAESLLSVEEVASILAGGDA